MPARTRPLTVVVGADTKPFQKGMKDADSTLSKFTKSTTNHTRSLAKYSLAASGVGLSVGGMGAALKTAVSSASDVSESLSKNQVLFGKYAKGVKKFSDTSATSFGISKRAALEYTGVFGNLFTALGVSGKESAKFSTNLTKLASDMASFNNTSIEDALEAIRSGLVGETEPLRKFGVNMNDATLKVEAHKLAKKGLIESSKANAKTLDPETKALAAQSLIVKQTEKAHGDFARTQGGLANQTKILRARLGDLQTNVGTALLPTITKGANSLNKFITEMQDGTGQGGRFVKKLEDIRDTITPIANKMISAGKGVARFVEKHPDVTKLAGAVVGVGLALKGIKFTSSATGFTDLLKVGKSAMSGLKRIMATGGTAAGEAAAARAAEGMADQLPSSVNARKSKFSAVGRTAGGFIGVAMGTAAVAVAGAALLKWLSQTNDQLEKKGGLAGLAGKISNIGESIARNAPGPVGDVSRAIIGNGSRRAGGGRIPGMPVAADTYPALLSPQEFVVTGDGERTLESMTFPGVLNWLEGAQAPHFQNGGRAPKRMVSGGRVAQVARQAGFRGSALARMIAIAYRESRFNEKAQNLKYPDHSIGLWQINQLAHKGRYGSDAALMDPLTNAKAAWQISGHGKNFNPWSTNAGLSSSALALGRRLAAGSRGSSSGSSGGSSSSSGSLTIGPRPSGDQIFLGFQAAQEGSSLRQFLGPALEYVGTPGSSSSSGSGVTASATSTRSSGGSRAGLQLPTTFRSTHQTAGLGGYPAIDVFAKPGTTVGSPIDGVVTKFSGSAGGPGAGGPYGYSMYISGGGKTYFLTHMGSRSVKVGQKVSKGQVIGTVADYPDRPDHIHEGVSGMRRGGRIARMARGGRGLHRYATGKRSGTVRSVGRGRTPSESTIRSLLGTIASGNPASIQGALRKAQTYMAAHPSIGALRGWINAANRRIEGKGVSAAGARGLQSFTALAQNELGRQLANPITAIDATEAGFDQGTTDLGNQLAASRATDAQTAGAQGALATSQLQTLYANRAGIATQLNRARRSGSKKTVQALEARLSQADSAILAKRAEVVGYQDAYTAATTGDTSVEDERNRLLQENTDALKAHADALTSVRDELKRQTDFAQSVQTTSASQLAKTLADVVSGQIAGGLTQRRFTAGVGTVASY